MADISDLQQSEVVRLVGRNEQLAVDIVDSGDGVNRLAVTAQTAPAALGTRFQEKLLNGSSPDMAVNGSGTPVQFSVTAPTTTQDLLVSRIRIFATDFSIDNDDFLGESSPLDNGLLVEIKSDNVTTTLANIQTTNDFRNLFSGVGGFYLNTSDSPNALTAEFIPNAPFFLRRQGVFSIDDFIRVTVRDNLNGVISLQALVVGTLE